MSQEAAFLKAIQSRPGDDLVRLVFADWLDERADPRGDFVRLHLALRTAAPDHPDRVSAEHELSDLRLLCDAGWLAIIEPERPQPGKEPSSRQVCGCFDMGGNPKKNLPTPRLHADTQDTACDAWKKLLDHIEEAAADGRETFAPLDDMPGPDRARIVTLPSTIAKLKAVRSLNLYGTHLVRLPPEVGEMSSLEDFDPYTSYRLHWFPYEITHCKNLRDSSVSTRALYGNYKYRPRFPTLTPVVEPERLPLKRFASTTTRPCSVCGTRFEDCGRHRVWVSLRVTTDVLPLLVNACSAECVGRLPTPPDGYVRVPHRGGEQLQQPAPR
ncbi:MAG TPA: TIGR02996 domain-containing protein [Gemmataceae bacterium]|nr:TIGR02996 domain-containing protein [Gemmataceae bacterium]